MNSSCQVCGTVLDPEGEGVRICPVCKSGSHDECWQHLGGCIQPECRKQMRKDAANAADTIPQRRQSALIRRRLSWIVAQELGWVSDFHPEEWRHALIAFVCFALSATTLILRYWILFEVLVGLTMFFLFLRWAHRRSRKKGQVPRWIPADAAPRDGVQVADWLLYLEGAGEHGRPSQQFGQDFLSEPSSRELFDRLIQQKVFATENQLVKLTPISLRFVDEARSRAVPRALMD